MARLGGEFARGPATQAGIGRDALVTLGAEQAGERQAEGTRLRVPCCHVEGGQRHPDQPLGAEQPKARGQRPRERGGRERLPRDQETEVRHHRRRRRECSRCVGEEVGPPNHTLLGQEVDQDERCRADRAGRGLQKRRERHVHRTHAQGANRQGGSRGRKWHMHGQEIRSGRGRARKDPIRVPRPTEPASDRCNL